MQVFQSAILRTLPGITHGTAPKSAQPLTFSGHTRQSVRRSRAHFAKQLHVNVHHLTLGRQVHGTKVRIVDDEQCGAGALDPATYLPRTDGLLTQRPGIALGIFTADCVPVLLADPRTGWIGALHVGWRGAVNGIAAVALAALQKHGVRMQDVRVWLGPAICGDCYSGHDRQRTQKLARAFGGHGVGRHAGHVHVDLRQGLHWQLRRSGILTRHIEISPVCTFEERRLPSHRREGHGHANTLTVISRASLPGDVRGLRVAVLGLGVQGGGEASVRAAALGHAQSVLALDEKPAAVFKDVRRRLRALNIAYAFGPTVRTASAKVDWVVKNPGVPLTHPYLKRARQAGASLVTDIGWFRALHDNPVIAVTGTKGKSTVVSWLAHVLRGVHRRVELAGNVRRSPLDIQKLQPETPVILELSSFQLEALEVPLAAKLAIVTNLYPDHLNRHRSMRTYARVKSRLSAGQDRHSTLILPLDSEWPQFGNIQSPAKRFFSSLVSQPKSDAYIRNGWIVLHGRRLVQTRTLRIQDVGSLRNAVTVALAAAAWGVPRRVITKRLCTFTGVPERFQVIRRYRGRTFINNTTATNPISAAFGMQSVAGSFILIAGGADKGLPLGPMLHAAKRSRCVVLLPGSATKLLKKRLECPTVAATSMREAVRVAWKQSQTGDTILLSPGAASFGIFTNEFDRGAQFTTAVRAL